MTGAAGLRSRPRGAVFRPRGATFLPRGVAALGVAALAVILAACTPAPDRGAVALCAGAAAVLAPPGRFRVAETADLPADAEGRPGLRIALEPRAPLPWLVCRFAGPDPDLAALVTPAGPLDDVHLWALTRYGLDTDEARAAAAEVEAAGLPELPFGAAYPLQQALNALPDAAVYGLLAAAYSLVYGLHGRINLAFGAVAAVGGVAAVVAAGLARGAPGAAVAGFAAVAGLWAALLHGAAAERLVLWPLRRVTGQQALVATVGLALMLREYLRLVAGAGPLWVPPLLAGPLRLARAGTFVVTVTPMAIALAAGAAAASAGLLIAFARTGFGRDWRASADDPLAAALMGVDPRRLSMRTAALAFALAGLAGAGATLTDGGTGFDYTTGLGLKALVAAVLGGIGSVPGAFLGGVGIAAVEAAWSAYGPIEQRDLVVDVALVALLVVRPGGLFGAREPAARRLP